MKKVVITKYQADDGSLHDTAEGAMVRDSQSIRVAEIMKPLGERYRDDECCYDNGHGYVKHDPCVVAEVTSNLLAFSREFYPDTANADDPDWLRRYFVGKNDVLKHAWYRIECIDRAGREWGQPFFAEHPSRAAMIEIRRGPSL